MNLRAAAFAMGLLLTTTLPIVAAPQTVDEFAKTVQPMLKQHCVKCHGEKEHKADLRLDLLTADVAAAKGAWAAALERLAAGDMPPDGEPRPEEKTVTAAIEWIRGRLAADTPVAEAATAAPIIPRDGNHVPHALLFGTAAPATQPPPPRLWRLRPLSYSEGFVHAIVRKGRGDLTQPFNLVPDVGIKDYAALYTIDGPGVEVLLRNAEKLVESQVADIADLRALAAANHPTAEQLEKAIRVQYHMALARAPTVEEVTRLKQLYEKCLKTGSSAAAVRTMLMAPLLSPEAAFRFELGSGPRVRPGVRMLSPREIAFALSLSLCDARDPVLFDLAQKGGLTSREEVAEQARRMLNESKLAKPRILGFFHEYFGYDAASDVFKDKPDDVLHAPEQMVRDTDRLIEYLLGEDKDVLTQLLTTHKSFVNYAEVTDRKTKQTTVKRGAEAHPINDRGRKHPEAVYGLDEWPSKQPVDLPGERIGILMQPSWLVAWSGNFDNDIVRRGRWVREQLLGGRVPDLPLGVAAKVPDDPSRTLRDRMQLTRDAACWKCHNKMDELGLAFEAFDHYGKPRTTEKVVDLDATAKNVDKHGKSLGKLYRDAELLTAGRITASGDPKLDGPVANPAEMMRRLAESTRVRQVFVRHVFRYYLGRNETAGDARTLQDADKAFVDSGGSFKALLVSLLSSESFLCRATPDDK